MCWWTYSHWDTVHTHSHTFNTFTFHCAQNSFHVHLNCSSCWVAKNKSRHFGLKNKNSISINILRMLKSTLVETVSSKAESIRKETHSRTQVFQRVDSECDFDCYSCHWQKGLRNWLFQNFKSFKFLIPLPHYQCAPIIFTYGNIS